MKRLLSIGLALSLIGSSAAMARESGHDYGRGSYGHSTPYRGGYGYRHNDNGAAAVGLGILALGVFGALAAQSNGYNGYYERGYYATPPNYGFSYRYNSYGPTYRSYGDSYRYGR
jgi:hypothetical protein